ncbi:MAG: NUDIX domain-containing protein [Saprospiraceae bacterium]|nr:NUDIX domain-containing protein [Saprospiraceae bacterium]
MNKQSIISSRVLHSGWSTLEEYLVEIESDKLGKHQVVREIYDSGDGAAALLINQDSCKVILIKQYRLAAHLNGHHDGYLLEACAGLLDKNDPDSTIIKEIYEETGIVVEEANYIGKAYATPGAHKELIHLYIAFYTEQDKKGDGGGLKEEYEDIEVLELTFNEVINLYKNGKIQDSKTLTLIQYAMIESFIHMID